MCLMRSTRWLQVCVVGLFVAGAGACARAIVSSDDSTTTDASSVTDATTSNDVTTKPGCDAPLIKCLNVDAGSEAGSCIDITTDINHCGQCTTACSTGDAGALEAGTGNPDSGIAYDGGSAWSLGTASCSKSACAITCPTSMTECSDHICYDTQNFHDNCGACGTACAADTEWCTTGHCCAVGTAYCSSSCTDILSDKNNCGTCGNVCGSSTPVCSAGKCTTAIIYSQAFTSGATPTTQCTAWDTFRASLTGTYTSITLSGSNDTTGRTCTGAGANTLCQALHNKTAVSALSCGGYTWNAYLTCSTDVELSADGTVCSCTASPAYDVRPCIANLNWGGVKTVSCSAPSQTLTVTCK